MQEVAKIFIEGIVTIGVISALFMSGRNTAGVLKAGFGGASGLLRVAETGK